MADEQLRGLSMRHVIVDEASGIFPALPQFRTDWQSIDAPRELVSVDYSNLEERWVLPDYGQSILTAEILRDMQRTLINNRRLGRSWVFPDIHGKYRQEEKPEIKRGNPWAQ